MALNRIAGGAALASLVLAVALLAGCATPPTDPEDRKEFDATNDPLEPTNRFFFGFNETIDHGFFRPVAIAYRDVVPEFGRQRVHDVITNLREPWIFANDVLQADANSAGATFSRFVINSTIGVLGLFDVAASSTFNLPYHDNDAGLTLARWGVPDGPYLVLPLLGPSNPRDATGIVAEYFLDPVSLYFDHHNLDVVNYTRTGVEALDTRTNYLDTLDSLERTSLDFYSTLRSISRQHRQDEINHKDVPVETAPAKQGNAQGAARQAAAEGKQ
ncbi:MAG TPA: VacJ family lipoprotein [Candidatus Sulfotelmatobacter sp.]|nr:VacJ family lipoprotein [Candidatus Sulfotelmatobacter sp.]